MEENSKNLKFKSSNIYYTHICFPG